tara:strand:+ start:7840 stop:8343 length:504 start_codon:yes stop_codon:yes gene_type:complete
MIVNPPIKNCYYIDNFLDEDLLQYLRSLFIKLPHYYGHSSKEGKGNAFYNHDLDLSNDLFRFLCEKIQKIEGLPIEVLRVYFNVQHCGMDGDFHRDDGDVTYLIMITKSLQPGDGCFEIKEKNKIKKIDFVQNRLIYFDASMPHRGRSPNKYEIEPRITLAFKTKTL